MANEPEPSFPTGNPVERELLLSWLGYLRGAVIRKVEDLSDRDARWTPDGHLISLLGVVKHLTSVEGRWIDGEMLGHDVNRTEEEFHPGVELTVEAAVTAYRQRAATTDAVVQGMPSLSVPCRADDGTDLRRVLLHLINETARHADTSRELLDGTTGE